MDSIAKSLYIHEYAYECGIICGRGSAPGNLIRMQSALCIEEIDIDYILLVLEEAAIKLIKEFKL